MTEEGEAGARGAKRESCRRKRRRGVVMSKSGSKSLVVRVERRYRDPKYGKVLTRYKKYHVHDERNEGGVGDLLEMVETRPISRMKRWRLTRIVRKGRIEAAQEETGAAAESV